MASHFTIDDAAPRIARLDATLRALVYSNRVVVASLFPGGGGVGHDSSSSAAAAQQQHIFVVTGELIALESGTIWLTTQWQRQRRRRWWYRSRHHCQPHSGSHYLACEMAAADAEFTGSVQTMMHRTGTNVYRIPAHAARMCGFDEAADLLDNAATAAATTTIIMVREYVYNAQTRASMHVTDGDGGGSER